jgi:hypothetical protein
MSITVAPTGHGFFNEQSSRIRAESLRTRIAAAFDRMTETLQIQPTTMSWQDDEAPRQQPYFGAFYC